MANYKVIDADGHVCESVAGMREFLEPRWQRRNLFPNDAWDRDLCGKLGAKPEGPEDQLAAMDEDGIDVMVLKDLTDDTKQEMLHDNVARFYQLADVG